MRSPAVAFWLIGVVGFSLPSCGDDADALGIGAECSADDYCDQDIEPPLKCLTGFKGGYCGLSGCSGDADCPENSGCIQHDDGQNYCFRLCKEKLECNENRTPEVESNCSANVTAVSGESVKACVPPSA